MEYLDFSISPEKKRISPVTVDAIYYVLANSRYHIRHGIIPDSLVFIATLSGHGKIQLEGKCLDIGSGDILLFDASRHIFEYQCTDFSWNFWWFEFRCPDPAFLDIPLARPQHAPIKSMELSLCEEALNSLKLQDQKTASFLMASLICMLSERSQETQQDSNDIMLFRKADQYIRHNLPTVTVKKIADHLNVSEHTLLNIFQSLLGIRTVEYIQKLKMDLACHQLTTSESTVREIADSLGYADQFTFSKCFRKHFSLSPTQYRKIYKAAN